MAAFTDSHHQSMAVPPYRLRNSLLSVLGSRTFTFMSKVRERRRGVTTISAKHQITVPVDALRAAGLAAGERLVARADGPGRIVLEREQDTLAEFVGALPGVWTDGDLDRMRDEWA